MLFGITQWLHAKGEAFLRTQFPNKFVKICTKYTALEKADIKSSV